MKLMEMMVWRRSSNYRRKEQSSNSNSHPSRTSSSSSQINMLDFLPTDPSDHVIISSSSPLSRSSTLFSLLRSLLTSIPIIPTCSVHRSRHITGTLFGNRNGYVSFSIQDHPRSPPLVLIQLPSSTSALVKEMSSGLLRIALECNKSSLVRLYNEPIWTMYCNGRKCSSYAASRACSDSDLHVLNTIQTVSAGAGVIPQLHDDVKADADSEGELLYMRARFERVVGTRDSEAFYMLNPDGNGGPDLSIFLLRL